MVPSRMERITAAAGIFCCIYVLVWNGILSNDEADGYPAFTGEEIVQGRFVENKLKKSKRGAERVPTEKFMAPLPWFGKGTVFSGHLVPDVDSVASAIAAAYLFEGVAMVPGELNAETAYLLDRLDIAPPPRLKDAYKGQKFVLVDHNAFAQRPKLLDAEKIVGIFDHHALSQEPTLVTKPIYVYIKPWGSCSSLIATQFLEHHVVLPKKLAALLMAGIISDTLNLKGPTATFWDRKVLHWLASRVEWSPGVFGRDMSLENFQKAIDTFAHAQFVAKANLTHMDLEQIVRSDFKPFYLSSTKLGRKTKVLVGWATIETVDPFYKVYLSPQKVCQLVHETMPKVAKHYSLEKFFLSVVDIEREISVVICANTEDCTLLKAAFPTFNLVSAGKSCAQGGILHSTPLVSRKKEFIPPLRKQLAATHRLLR
uniref:inorganic diphosphatase n=1 Tax=Mucochytrium quahogii TaxID=96639 RepID=A0A7S2WFW2_9STRA|mmetsp:Transcript_38854/g.62563  ORF Transcript_38854/g.62563 Transcript_38854/m.62563 type:complete len:427 (-) Transcript_38854:322-1602(-)